MAHANIEPVPAPVAWESTDIAKSLRDVQNLVETEAVSAIQWYLAAKRWKRLTSQGIQFAALLLTALAGIAPILIQLLKTKSGPLYQSDFDSGPLASLCVGVAAALLGLDRAFGYSTGWTRYVLTSTSITKLLHEFRLDWLMLRAASGAAPTPEQQQALLHRAKEFISSIQALVLQETKDWATEFQTNIARIEKDLNTQLDTLKSQMEQAARDKETAARPAAIEVTVTNAESLDNFTWKVLLDGPTTQSSPAVANSKTWSAINLKAGHYRLIINAKAKGAPVAAETVVDCKPAEIAKPSVTLPLV